MTSATSASTSEAILEDLFTSIKKKKEDSGEEGSEDETEVETEAEEAVTEENEEEEEERRRKRKKKKKKHKHKRKKRKKKSSGEEDEENEAPEQRRIRRISGDHFQQDLRTSGSKTSEKHRTWYAGDDRRDYIKRDSSRSRNHEQDRLRDPYPDLRARDYDRDGHARRERDFHSERRDLHDYRRHDHQRRHYEREREGYREERHHRRHPRDGERHESSYRDSRTSRRSGSRKSQESRPPVRKDEDVFWETKWEAMELQKKADHMVSVVNVG